MREVTVERGLVERVESMGGIAAKHVSPGRAGDPDRLVAVPMPGGCCPMCGTAARVGLLELKAPSGGLRELQERRMEQWRAVGVPSGWANGHGAVLAWLERLQRGVH